MGMGKLGARELNYSSDIDLIFAYPSAGTTDRGRGNDEFFTSLGRRLIKMLGAKTADGQVFRVDMRLRPYGESGPLAMSFDAMEEYYQYQGREWERYAWIKARVITGAAESGRDLMARIKPFVYRRYLDYGTFETLRGMKQKIALEVTRKGLTDNIKTGPGGIREIEFFGQVFQMLRGGVLPVLQRRRICHVLGLLVEENLVPSGVRDELVDAYRFLRRTEHRLQEFADQQTHTLPQAPDERQRLALSMGFPDWTAFAAALDRHRRQVHAHFQSLLAPEENNGSPDAGENALLGVWRQWIDAEAAAKSLSDAGFQSATAVMEQIGAVRKDLDTRTSSAETRNRMDKLMPRLLKAVGEAQDPDLVLERLLHLIRAVESRACYLALLLENPDALGHLIQLVHASPWVSSFLSRHPALLDELLDSRTLYAAPLRPELEADLGRRMAGLPDDDLEEQMELLRIFKQSHTLRVAAADISGNIPLMRVSDYLSYIAESILQQVLAVCWQHLTKQHGEPSCHLDGHRLQKGFALIAYGKLGGLELGYSSELELVFLHAGQPGKTAGGPKPINNADFFKRLGQRVIHLLNAHTAAGVLYELDIGLRPSGSYGLLVSRIDTFRDYQLKEAWSWEHHALVRARTICGDQALMDHFDTVRRKALARPRPRQQLRAAVLDLRQRVQRNRESEANGNFDLNRSPGGIGDIELLVQYLVLLEAHKHPEIVNRTDVVRQIQALARAGVLDDGTAYLLRGAYLRYRALRHRLSLQEKPPRISAKRIADLRHAVLRLWRRYLAPGPGSAGFPSSMSNVSKL